MFLTIILKTKLALLDSGATENFLDLQTIVKLRLPTTKLKQVQVITNIDGTYNKAGSITRKCWLKMTLGIHSEEIDFFVIDLGQDYMVLGYPFLHCFNPAINWEVGELNGQKHLQITPIQIMEHEWHLWKFEHCGTQAWKTTFTQQWATKANKQRQLLIEDNLPEKYLRHSQVFSEKEAQQLPPSQIEDMAINLKERAPDELDCKTYALTKTEMEVLQQTLSKDLQKGYIKHGTLPYISPVFFIDKKDGKDLWMVINYQQLNDITKKDFYPFPNLCIELEKLSKTPFFFPSLTYTPCENWYFPLPFTSTTLSSTLVHIYMPACPVR